MSWAQLRMRFASFVYVYIHSLTFLIVHTLCALCTKLTDTQPFTLLSFIVILFISLSVYLPSYWSRLRESVSTSSSFLHFFIFCIFSSFFFSLPFICCYYCMWYSSVSDNKIHSFTPYILYVYVCLFTIIITWKHTVCIVYAMLYACINYWTIV